MNTLAAQGQIKVSVSSELKSLVQSRADGIGVPVAQYVKNLIINDVKQPIYQVDTETEKRIGQSLQDLKDGRYTIIQGKKELDAHLDSI